MRDWQAGYVLLPVVLLITLISVVAFLLNHESALGTGTTGSFAESTQADHVARAGLAHAQWWTQTNGCLGDQTMTTVPFGPSGAHNYTATVTSPGGTNASYALSADQDAWFRSDDITKNNGTTTTYHLRMESSNLEYAVVRFDLSALAAGAQIQSATAHFYVKATKGHPEGPVNVHRVTADWTETGATWETMSSNFDSTVLSMVPPQPAAGDNWVQLNLTAQVQAWVNGEPNYGIMLVPIGEGTHAEYISREGAGSQQPRLDVVVGTGPATPVTIAATGTLDSGLTRTLTRMVGANQPPGNMFLQLGADAGEDTLLDSFYDLRNYGGADYMQVHDNGTDWQQYPLIRFDLARLPRGAAVRSARLELSLMSVNTPGTATIHQVTRSWVEGTKVGGGTADGATWFTHDGTNPWTSAGGDINTPVVDETAINGSETWVSWEIAPLVERWLAGEPNYGLLIKPDSALDEARFASKENSNFDVQPKLTITYACECGSACLAPQGSGNVLIVVINPTTLVPLDAHKKALFESWGYTVSVVGESANQASYDSAIAAADVVFISETVNANQVGTKLQDVTIGVISQDGSYNSALGLAAGSAWPVASAINVTDTSHYITAPFPTGPLEIYAAAMEQLTVSGSEAPGLQTLADSGGAGALVVLDAGAMGTGGTPLAGRRVMLPLGRDNSFNWGYLNNDGRLLVQRALAWGMRADVTSAGNLLLVVGDPGNLTSQESAKKALMESWKFTVNLIDESDSQANFDTAIAANDVAYIPQDINATNLGTKLANAPIGVVNEEGEQVDELDFSGGILFKTNHAIDVVDNTHYITQPFATGFLTFTSSDQSVHMLSGQIAPGLQTLGQTLNTGTQYKPSLATLDVGDTLSSGGSAVGRRVQLPWGGGTFDINLLTDDGRTIMRRAIEWGAGAGSAPSYAVLLVVGDATTLSSKDAGRKTLIESWGHTVTLIDDGDTQANFDAAAASTDVVFVTASIGGGTLGNKLTGSSAPIVNEFNGKLDNFGFSSGTSTFALADAFTKTDALHYITEPFSGNPVTVFSGSLSMPVPSGTLAPDLANAGELTGIPALVTLDTGATRYDGNPAPARRAHLPFGPAETTDLTADGETILQRALEWAAGASSGATPQQILLVVADASSLTAQDLARKTLMEGWGYGVKTISASDSQANFDAAVATADAAYVAEQQQSTALGTKLRNVTIAVINEEAELRQDIGFSANRDWPSTRDSVDIVDNSHYITSPFATGLLTIALAPIEVVTLSGQMAGGLQVLGQQDWGGPQNSLSVIETGGALYGGGTAAGRRVQLPWGRTGFDINALNTNGLKLMQRAIEWGIAGGGGGGGGPPPAGPVFEEFTDASRSSNGTSLIISKPAATAVGDLLLAAVATDGDNTSSLAPPAGWNVINVADRGREVTFGVWWKLAGASESNSYTFSWSSSEQAYGWIMRFTGHDPASPIDANSNDIGSTASPSSPSVTTTVNNTLILRLGGFDDDDITVGAPGLSGHTAINMNDSGNGNFTASGGSGYVLQAAAGGSGTSSFTLTNTEGYVTVTIAIAPAP